MDIDYGTRLGGLTKLLSREEIFDRAYRHALTMTKPSVETNISNYDGASLCSYFNVDGDGYNMCLIGAVLGKDIAACMGSLNESASNLNRNIYRFFNSDTDDDENFLEELQSCHDKASFGYKDFQKVMLYNLKAFASKYALKIPDVQAS